MDNIFTDLLKANHSEFINLTQDTLSTNMLLIGEVHGVMENAYLYYSLFKIFEFDSIAMEYPVSLKEPILNYLNTGVFPIHRMTESMNDGKINKTYILLLKTLSQEGLLKNIIFYDPEQPTYDHWNERDKAFADSYSAQYKQGNKVLIITGNMHAQTLPFEINSDSRMEKGQLFSLTYNLIQTYGNFPVCKIYYHSGKFYNFGNKEFPKTHMPMSMLRKRQSEKMRYEIHLDNVNPVETF